MDFSWTLPQDAKLTVLEADLASRLAQIKVKSDWISLEFPGQPPRISPAVVHAVFTAIKEVLDRKDRIAEVG